MTNKDLTEIVNNLPEQDLIEIHKRAVRPTYDLISRHPNGSNPQIIGLFGGWGQGKTTALGYLSKKLITQRPNVRVYYFNAWQYANDDEMIPTLVHRIVTQLAEIAGEDISYRLLQSIGHYGKAFADAFSSFTEATLGINGSELIQKVLDTKRQLAEDPKPKALTDQFFGKVDYVQDMIRDISIEARKTDPNHRLVVMIDELDRCDPEEAYDAIRKLRVLLSIPESNLTIIICANPEPIGQALAHKHGLSNAGPGFNPSRILEKFVTDYISTNQPTHLNWFIDELFAKVTRSIPPKREITVIHKIEDSINQEKLLDNWSWNTINWAMIQMIDTGNHHYSNLRILDKALDVAIRNSAPSKHKYIWTYWHLAIIDIVDPKLSNSIRAIAPLITEAATDCTARLIRAAQKLGMFEKANTTNEEDMLPVPGGDLNEHCSPFAFYRMCMYTKLREIANREESKADGQSKFRGQLLQSILTTVDDAEFIISLSAHSSGPDDFDSKGFLKYAGQYGYALFHN
jgi:hypothetical protein